MKLVVFETDVLYGGLLSPESDQSPVGRSFGRRAKPPKFQLQEGFGNFFGLVSCRRDCGLSILRLNIIRNFYPFNVSMLNP
jgi:hypothetical protein